MASDSPMTEQQGREVIQLLKDILWELKNGSIQGIESSVGSIQHDVDSIQRDVSSIECKA